MRARRRARATESCRSRVIDSSDGFLSHDRWNASQCPLTVRPRGARAGVVDARGGLARARRVDASTDAREGISARVERARAVSVARRARVGRVGSMRATTRCVAASRGIFASRWTRARRGGGVSFEVRARDDSVRSMRAVRASARRGRAREGGRTRVGLKSRRPLARRSRWRRARGDIRAGRARGGGSGGCGRVRSDGGVGCHGFARVRARWRRRVIDEGTRDARAQV